MTIKTLKLIPAAFLGLGALIIFGPHAAFASGGDFTFGIDHAVSGAPGDYKKSTAIQIEQGEWVNVRMNSVWNLSSGCWPGAGGPKCTPKDSIGKSANTVVVWKADTCLPGADCSMFTSQDKDDSKKLTWNIVPNFSYQPYLSIRTSDNTPEGTYPVTFSLEEHPESCKSSGNKCIAKKSATISIKVKGKEKKDKEAGQCEISSSSFKFLKFENLYPTYWAAWGELEFYDSEGKKLKPAIAGGSGDWIYPSQGAYGKPSAIDGNRYTQWNNAAPGWITPFEHPSYILLDFGKNVTLGRMRFQTEGGSNREVNIYTGHAEKNTKTLLKQIKGYYDDKSWIDFDCRQPAYPQIYINPSVLSFAGASGGAAPSGQEAAIKNTGNGNLNWDASANSDWCHVSPASGTLAPGETQRLAVSVDRPSNAGSFSCLVSFADPNAPNSPQNLAVTYTVSPPPVGNPAAVSATADSCEKIKVSWEAAANAKGYNLYRNTAAAVPAVPYKVGIQETLFVDSNAVSEAKYYYWVQSEGGGEKVAAAPGGVSADSCLSVPKAPQRLAADNSQCGSLVLTWASVSGGAGYYVYRGTSSAGFSASSRIATLSKGAVSYRDQAVPGKYYYWVSSYNTAGESKPAAVAGNPQAINSCQADLSQSDKNLRSVNGAVQPNSDCDSGLFQGLPMQEGLRQGDILVFEVNLCNSKGQGDAAGVVVTEFLTNLAAPAEGWKPALDGKQLKPVLSDPQPGEYFYSQNDNKLVFNVGQVGRGAVRQITYQAKIQPQASTTGGCLRCQNKSVINYFKDPQTAGTEELHIPALYFVKGN